MRIPESHELPFKVLNQETLSDSGIESDVLKLRVGSGGGNSKNIVLKESRLTRLASGEEMRKQQTYYDFLKNHSKFGKYVTETSFILARRSSGEPVRNYKIQKHLEGKRLDELSDREIFADKELTSQLIEFIEDVSGLLRDILQHPEFGKLDLYADTKSFVSYIRANFFQNPRFTGNILISPKLAEGSQRIHFIDSSEIRSVPRTLRKLDKAAQPITTKMQLKNLNSWKQKLQKHFKNPAH